MEVIEYKDRKRILNRLLNKRYILQFLPSPLDEISKIKFIKFNNHNLKSSYIIDIIHGMLLKYYFKKENSFNLYSIILKERYGHKYNYYINYLIKNDFLILIKNHQKGKNSRVYKISESIINSTINRYQNRDNILMKKYKNAVSLIEDTSSIGIFPEVKRKLVEDLFSVKIDYGKSIFFLDNTNQGSDVYNKNRYSVDCIKENHIFYHFDDYGRLHTNFTILKSFIQHHILQFLFHQIHHQKLLLVLGLAI